MTMRTEWVIHIWGKEREVLEFTPQEKFHMDMIRYIDHSIFNKVLINIAMYDINDDEQDIRFPKLRTHLADGKDEVTVDKHENEYSSAHEVFATDNSTSWDIPKFCMHLGHELLLQEEKLDEDGNKEFHYLVKKG